MGDENEKVDNEEVTEVKPKRKPARPLKEIPAKAEYYVELFRGGK